MSTCRPPTSSCSSTVKKLGSECLLVPSVRLGSGHGGHAAWRPRASDSRPSKRAPSSPTRLAYSGTAALQVGGISSSGVSAGVSRKSVSRQLAAGPPRLSWLLVEAPHRRQRLGEEVAGHAVVHHLEEADGLGGGPHLGDNLLPVVVLDLEVDDRDGVIITASSSCVVVGVQRRVVEDGRDGVDARVDEALDAGLGVVEGLELPEAVGGSHE
nr:unnamed protein product [Digitaria exilis]